MNRKGILLAGGTGTRLYPLTLSVNKHLLPVYDKPMVFYPLAILMQAGIREILIVSTPEDLPRYRNLLGTGENFGLRLSYVVQEKPDGLANAFLLGADFIGTSPSCLILGDNLFYGLGLGPLFRIACAQTSGATIFAYRVSTPGNYGVVELDSSNVPISLEEKPAKPKSFWAVPGLYFYDGTAIARARTLTPSPRGELEITDLNRLYLNDHALRAEPLPRGTAWLDTGTHESLFVAGDYIRAIQGRQGMKVACLEEIAFVNRWITVAQLRQQAVSYGNSSYGEYLRILGAAARD